MNDERVFVGLGSNLGDRAAFLAAARDGLARAGFRIVAASTVVETPAEGIPGAPPFLNQVLEVRTALSPRETLAALHALEGSLGRVRSADGRVLSRTIDLDLLLYGERTSDDPACLLPHPRAAGRPFVAGPLAEIAPEVSLRRPAGAQAA